MGLLFLPILAILAVVFYLVAVQSRKAYHCPSCGEHFQTEHMTAVHCNTCGAPLKEEIR